MKTRILLGALLISPLFLYPYQYVSDWHIFFAAGNGTLVDTAHFHNPIWTIWLLKPFTLLGSQYGYALSISMVISSTLIISKRLTNKYLPAILAIVSIPFLRLMIHGQTPELFVLWGVFSSSLILSPMLLLVKPQTAVIAVLGRFRHNRLIAVTFVVFLIVAAITIKFGTVNDINQNVSIYPYGIPIGVFFAYKALKNGDVLSGAIATPFIAPYLITHSLFVPLFAFYIRFPKLSLFVWAAVWGVLLHFSG